VVTPPCAAGVDHHVAGVHLARRSGADGDDALALGDDRIAFGQRGVEIARDDCADIDERDAHGSSAGKGWAASVAGNALLSPMWARTGRPPSPIDTAWS
jgi:hypothetical protein